MVALVAGCPPVPPRRRDERRLTPRLAFTRTFVSTTGVVTVRPRHLEEHALFSLYGTNEIHGKASCCVKLPGPPMRHP